MPKERDREKEKEKDRKAETLNHLSIHQWVRSAIFAPQQLTSPIGFLFLKLPPPPCAVLLVWSWMIMNGHEICLIWMEFRFLMEKNRNMFDRNFVNELMVMINEMDSKKAHFLGFARSFAQSWRLYIGKFECARPSPEWHGLETEQVKDFWSYQMCLYESVWFLLKNLFVDVFGSWLAMSMFAGFYDSCLSGLCVSEFIQRYEMLFDLTGYSLGQSPPELHGHYCCSLMLLVVDYEDIWAHNHVVVFSVGHAWPTTCGRPQPDSRLLTSSKMVRTDLGYCTILGP